MLRYFSSTTCQRLALHSTKEAGLTRSYVTNSSKTAGKPNFSKRHKILTGTLAVGVGGYCTCKLYKLVKPPEPEREERGKEATPLAALHWVTPLYKCLPLKIMSKLWGDMNSVTLPMFMRAPILKAYINAFNCNLDEAVVRDLNHYKNLGQFFRRRLRPDVRPQDTSVSLTCPCDGKVLHLGTIEGDQVEQVKGMTYSLQNYLGPPTWTKPQEKPNNSTGSAPVPPHKTPPLPPDQYVSTITKHPHTRLYQCVIYLAPGDYHGFHSPTEWSVQYRRHFPGELLSVSYTISRIVRGLFCLNERAVYFGEWSGGFMSMAAIGATNVGSIKIYHDTELATNTVHRYPAGAYFDETFVRPDVPGIGMTRGESFGEFNLGSTIILVFEAPKDFKFAIKPGETVKLGTALGDYKH